MKIIILVLTILTASSVHALWWGGRDRTHITNTPPQRPSYGPTEIAAALAKGQDFRMIIEAAKVAGTPTSIMMSSLISGGVLADRVIIGMIQKGYSANEVIKTVATPGAIPTGPSAGKSASDIMLTAAKNGKGNIDVSLVIAKASGTPVSAIMSALVAGKFDGARVVQAMVQRGFSAPDVLKTALSDGGKSIRASSASLLAAAIEGGAKVEQVAVLAKSAGLPASVVSDGLAQSGSTALKAMIGAGYSGPEVVVAETGRTKSSLDALTILAGTGAKSDIVVAAAKAVGASAADLNHALLNSGRSAAYIVTTVAQAGFPAKDVIAMVSTYRSDWNSIILAAKKNGVPVTDIATGMNANGQRANEVTYALISQGYSPADIVKAAAVTTSINSVEMLRALIDTDRRSGRTSMDSIAAAAKTAGISTKDILSAISSSNIPVSALIKAGYPAQDVIAYASRSQMSPEAITFQAKSVGVSASDITAWLSALSQQPTVTSKAVDSPATFSSDVVKAAISAGADPSSVLAPTASGVPPASNVVAPVAPAATVVGFSGVAFSNSVSSSIGGGGARAVSPN